jgi:hypothetical protein
LLLALLQLRAALALATCRRVKVEGEVFSSRQLNADAAASVAAGLMLILSADIAAVSNTDDADVACHKRCRC